MKHADSLFIMVHSEHILSMPEVKVLMSKVLTNLSDKTARSEPEYCHSEDGDRFALGRLCAPEFRWNADLGLNSAIGSSFELLGTLVDYIRWLSSVREAMAAIFESFVNSPLKQSLPECQTVYEVLCRHSTPVPVMEVLYKGAQEYGLLGLNKYNVHEMDYVGEGDVMCIQDRPDHLGKDTPHHFRLMQEAKCGGLSEGHSLRVTMLDMSSEEELDQDIWLKTRDKTVCFRVLSVVQSRA